MDTSVYWIAGAVAGLAIALIAAVISKKNFIKEFDERQNMLRGNAYRRAFFTVLTVGALYTAVTAVLGRPLMEDGVSAMMTVCVGVAVFAVDCIVHDAFFTVKEKPWPYLLMSGAIAMSNGMNGLIKLRDGEVIRDGVVTLAGCQLAFGVVFFVIFATVLVKVYIIRGDGE